MKPKNSVLRIKEGYSDIKSINLIKIAEVNSLRLFFIKSTFLVPKAIGTIDYFSIEINSTSKINIEKGLIAPCSFGP